MLLGNFTTPAYSNFTAFDHDVFNFTTLNSTTSTDVISFWNLSSLVPSIILSVCVLLAFPGNVAVILVLCCYPQRVRLGRSLMINLALSDLLALVIMPVWIYSLLHSWTMGRNVCLLISFVSHFSAYSGILTVTALSVQRYLQVLYPRFWERLGAFGEKGLLGLIWAAAAVIASPNAVFRDVVVRNKRPQCLFSFGSKAEKVTAALVELLPGFVVPFSVMIVSYFCLHKKVNQSAFPQNSRMTQLVSRIIAAFFIFWTPVHINNVFSIVVTLAELKELEPYVQMGRNITAALTLVNSCLNPFLYALAARAQRNHVANESVTVNHMSTREPQMDGSRSTREP